MARSHARILSTIWTDPEFTALDSSTQRLYLFLLSQPDLNHAGLLPLRERRWAAKAAGYTAKKLTQDLEALAAARFVVIDHDTEELLIRTLVRNDGIYKQPKVMIRLREDARQIESPTLRAAFLVELTRLPLHELSDKPSGPAGDGPSTQQCVCDIVRALHDDLGTPTAGVPDTPPGTHPDTPGDTRPETHTEPSYVRAGAFPQPPTPSPLPHTSPPRASAPTHERTPAHTRDRPPPTRSTTDQRVEAALRLADYLDQNPPTRRALP